MEYICKEVDSPYGGYLRPETELIRCKDCKAFNGMNCVRNNMIAVRTDDYCSRAERKEE